MEVPNPPELRPIDAISPTTYEAALKCGSRAVWSVLAPHGVIPQHPAALLGQSFHAVLAAANRGEIEGTSDERRESARRLFCESAAAVLMASHPHLRTKFRSPQELPFFNASCERAALQASLMEPRRPPIRSNAGVQRAGGSRTEGLLASSNGRIVGRLDRIDATSETVIDYKSGRGGGQQLSDPERRQLRLYVHLAIQNGIFVRRGKIVRSNGQEILEDISCQEGSDEAEKAEGLLDELNSRIEAGASFAELATPSPESCKDCPCIPLCSRFWSESRPEWSEAVGIHVEGRVTGVQESRIRGVEVVAISLDLLRGTTPQGLGALQAFPRDWMTVGSGGPPTMGGLIRVAGARATDGTSPLSILVDRAGTTLWSLKE